MKRLATGALMAVMIVVFATGGTAQADGPPNKDSSDGYWLTEYEGSQLQREDRARAESDDYAQDTALNGCRYETGADNPHVTDNQASVHGWWEKKNSRCPSRADVTVWLQAAWCSSSGICWWVTLDTDSDRIRPGGGRGKRVNVRDDCSSNEWTYYRNVVDVDIPGTIDLPNKARKVKQIQCRPPGPGYGS